MTNRRIGVPLSQEGAFENLEIAAEAVGKVEESNRHASYLIIKARHGLNPVRIRCSVMSGGTDSSSVIEFSGRGQDIWGVASRKMIDALIDVLGVVVQMDTQSAKDQPSELRKCPYCAEDIQSAAIKCKHCGESVQPLTTQAGTGPKTPSVQATPTMTRCPSCGMSYNSAKLARCPRCNSTAPPGS